jgi:hypothetical protein
MDHEPTRDPRIREAIEACRPGSDDLSDPSLAWLATRLEAEPGLRAEYEKVQEADASLAEAFRDVSVPQGLVERIAARLQAEPSGPGVSEAASNEPLSEASDEPAVAGPPPAPRATHREIFRRRWMLAGAGCFAVAGTILAAIVLINRPGDENFTASAVYEKAIDFFDGETGATEPGQWIGEAPPPRAYRLSPEVARLPQIRWRSIQGFLGRPGVAYDLTPPGSPRATLYVVACTVPGLPTVPPPAPALNSRRFFAAAWQSGPLVYVLVVEGGPRTYRSVLDLSSGALT